MLVSTVGSVPSGTLGTLMAGARLVGVAGGGNERQNVGYPPTTPATGLPFPYRSTLSTQVTKSRVYETPTAL